MAKKKVMMVVISKGNVDVMANGLKTRAMQVLAEFMETEEAARVMQDDKYLIMTFDAKAKGDAQWVRTHLTNKVDILGADDAAGIKKKADRLADMFEDSGEPKGKLGYEVIMSYLAEFYLIEKNASVFEVEV